MNMSPNNRVFRFAAVCTLLLLAGCDTTGVVVGAAATTGVAAAQERSVGDALDDTALKAKINQALFTADEFLFLDVSTTIVEGRVLLTGDVDKPEDRVEASRIVWNVKGVREVVNELQVNDQSGLDDLARDTWISTRLRARLLGDGSIAHINYSVETVNGVIYQIGIAQDEAELQRVTNHARVISGVKRVISHVRMKNDPRRFEQ